MFSLISTITGAPTFEFYQIVRGIDGRLHVDYLHSDYVRLGSVDDLVTLLLLLLLTGTNNDVAVGRRLVNLGVDVAQLTTAAAIGVLAPCGP